MSEVAPTVLQASTLLNELEIEQRSSVEVAEVVTRKANKGSASIDRLQWILHQSAMPLIEPSLITS